MKFPSLKHPLLCRITLYTVTLGAFLIPVIIAFNLQFLSDLIKTIILIADSIIFLIFLIKNFVLLMSVDFTLVLMNHNKKTRKQFILPNSFSAEKTVKKISGFGKKYEPIKKYPLPEILRYKSSAPLTIYSKGIEKIFITYNTDFLDTDEYISIINSAKANSNSLKGKKKHIFLDKEQKKAPINQAVAIIIFANKIEEHFQNNIYETVCKNNGDEYDVSYLPCIIDLSNKSCTFDSLNAPNIGQYPAKNRGIRMIKKYIFNGRLPLKNSPAAPAIEEDIDLNLSLWKFLKDTKKEFILDDKNRKKRFKQMQHGEVVFEDDFLYVKWNEQGIYLSAELNDEEQIAEIDEINLWDYPKTANIKKNTINNLKSLIDSHFAQMGYSTKYITFDDD